MTYHHGDLRTALLDAAEAELKADPRCTLSIRALASKIGVSSTAPHSHFKTKTDLLAALAIRGFDRLRRETLQNSAEASTVEDKLICLAEAYLGFSEANPGLYRIMFQTGADFEAHPELKDASRASFGVLRDAVMELGPATPSHNPQDLAFTAWAAVHGIASLLSEGRISSEIVSSTNVADLAKIVGQLIVWSRSTSER